MRVTGLKAQLILNLRQRLKFIMKDKAALKGQLNLFQKQ